MLSGRHAARGLDGGNDGIFSGKCRARLAGESFEGLADILASIKSCYNLFVYFAIHGLRDGDLRPGGTNYYIIINDPEVIVVEGFRITFGNFPAFKIIAITA